MRVPRTVPTLLSALLSALLAGCHVYTPLDAGQLPPRGELALWLSDRGRLAAEPTLGRDIERVEGRVAEITDTAYVLRVSRVRDARGVVTQWTGETVTVPRAWIGNTGARRLSRSRTYLLAGAFAAGAATFIATRVLGVEGPTYQGTGGEGGGGNDQ